MKKTALFLSVFLLTSFCLFASDPEVGGIFFDKAIKEYMQGNRETAMDSFEKCLKYTPDNEDAKKVYARLLVARSSEFFYNNEIEKSFIDIKRAKELLPRDEQVNKLFEFVKNAFEERFRTVPKQEQKEMVTYLTGAYLERETEAGNAVPAGNVQRYILPAAIIIAIFLLLMLLSVNVTLGRYMKARKEEVSAQKIALERLMFAVKTGKDPRQKTDPATVLDSGFSHAPSEMSRILKNSDASIRAKALMILEAEMLEKDRPMAVKILEPLLMDEDPLIRANAARAILSHDKNRGMNVLQHMASGDRDNQIAALHAMGWNGNDKAAAILLKKAGNKDGKISSAAVKSLMHMRERGYAGLTKARAQEIKRALDLVVINNKAGE